MKSERKIGIAQILLSGICFGFLGLFGKWAFAAGIEPGEFLAIRFLIGGLCSGALVLATEPSALRMTPRTVGICFMLGVFGYAIEASCFFYALKGLSASFTVLLLYTYPLIVTAGAWFLFGEKIQRRKFAALPLVMIGLIFLIWGDVQVLNPWAIAFGLGSAVSYALYILASSHFLKGVHPLASVTVIQLSAGIILAALNSPYLFTSERTLLTLFLSNWPLMMGAGVISSTLAMGLFLAGLKKLKNWEVSVLSTSEPVSNIVLAILFLGETLSLTQSLGAVAILGAFLLVAA